MYPLLQRRRTSCAWLAIRALRILLEVCHAICHCEDCQNLSYEASLDYEYFNPSGRAYLELSQPFFMEQALMALRKPALSTYIIEASPCPPPSPQLRMRGTAGRAEANDRGAVAGNGPNAGVSPSGYGVAIWGLPGTLRTTELREYLASNELVDVNPDGQGACEVLKADS